MTAEWKEIRLFANLFMNYWPNKNAQAIEWYARERKINEKKKAVRKKKKTKQTKWTGDADPTALALARNRIT